MSQSPQNGSRFPLLSSFLNSKTTSNVAIPSKRVKVSTNLDIYTSKGILPSLSQSPQIGSRFPLRTKKRLEQWTECRNPLKSGQGFHELSDELSVDELSLESQSPQIGSRFPPRFDGLVESLEGYSRNPLKSGQGFHLVTI